MPKSAELSTNPTSYNPFVLLARSNSPQDLRNKTDLPKDELSQRTTELWYRKNKSLQKDSLNTNELECLGLHAMMSIKKLSKKENTAASID